MSWIRSGLIANGVSADLSLADALDAMEVLVRTGRAIPAAKWVPWVKARHELQSIHALF